VTPGTYFNKLESPGPKRCSIPKINAFRPVVHEKNILEDLSKISFFVPYWAKKGDSPFI